MQQRAISFLGLFVLLFLAWLLSSHRGRVRPRIVVGGVLLQFAFAALILKTAAGLRIFQTIGDFFTALLGFVDVGSQFVFGHLIVEPGSNRLIFAFQVLPTIIFFSSLMSILYYLGVMQWIVRLAAVLMQRTLGTSGAESLSAAANIFVGQTEAPLVIRPYVETMTRSELMAVMIGGFATIAGGVLAAYVSFGIDAGHLVTASVISAPAALVVAKILEPETERPKTLGAVEISAPSEARNLVDAASLGAIDGLKLALNVAAMLIAFLALIEILKFGVAWLGGLFDQQWSLAALLGYLNAPFAWLIGVEPRDCLRFGELLGLRVVGNEFIAYLQLSQWSEPESSVQLSERSRMLATYALCGFANFGSIGIQIGGIGALAPNRRGELAQLGLRAMIGGLLACYMTACVAGVLL